VIEPSLENSQSSQGKTQKKEGDSSEVQSACKKRKRENDDIKQACAKVVKLEARRIELEKTVRDAVEEHKRAVKKCEECAEQEKTAKEELDKADDGAYLAVDQILQNHEDIIESTFLTTLIESVTCSICHSIFRAPVSLTCGHTFCTLCLRALIEAKAECAVCRAPVEGSFWKNVQISKITDSVWGMIVGTCERICEGGEEGGGGGGGGASS
jgi:hypothetical protein